MTDDVREEMKYYKCLAMAVEERLRCLQMVQDKSLESSSIDDDSTHVSSTNDSHDLRSFHDDRQLIALARQVVAASCNSHRATTQRGQTRANTKKQTISGSSSNESSFNSESLEPALVDSSTPRKSTTKHNRPQVPKTLDVVPIRCCDTSPPKFVRKGENDENDKQRLSDSGGGKLIPP